MTLPRPAVEALAIPAAEDHPRVPIGEVGRVAGALAIVLLLAFAARAVARRTALGAGGAVGRPSGLLEILARYPLGRGHALLVLRLARRVLLVHQSGSSMTTLSEITDPDEIAGMLRRMEDGSASREADRFGDVLRRFLAEDHGAVGEPGDVEVVDLTRSERGGQRRKGRTR